MATVRVALWVIPFPKLKRAMETDRFPHLRLPEFSEEQIAWAVRLSSRYIPGASCLTQALTAQILLNRAGLGSQLHIGVAKGDAFESHAWIECGGRVLVGGAGQSARYVRILTLVGRPGTTTT